MTMTATKMKDSRGEDSARRLAADLVTALESLATSPLSGDMLKQQANAAHYMGRKRLGAILQADVNSQQDGNPERSRVVTLLRQANREIESGDFDGSAADLIRALCRELGLSHIEVVDRGAR